MEIETYFPIRNVRTETTHLFDNDDPRNLYANPTARTICGIDVPNVQEAFSADTSLMCTRCVDIENSRDARARRNEVVAQ